MGCFVTRKQGSGPKTTPPPLHPPTPPKYTRAVLDIAAPKVFFSCLCRPQAGNKLQNLSEKELQVVEKLSQGIVNKMLHGPMSALRQPDGPDEKKQTLKILKDMFKLEKL